MKKIIFSIVFAFPILIFAQEQDKVCPRKLRLSNVQTNSKSCVSDLSFSNHIVEKKEGKNVTLTEKIVKKDCYELAISSDAACLSVGLSDDSFAEEHCFHPEAKKRLEYSALTKCRDSGCNCKVIISNGKIIEEELLNKINAAYLTDGLTTVGRVAEKKEVNQPIENKNSPKSFSLNLAATKPNKIGEIEILISSDESIRSLLINDELIHVNKKSLSLKKVILAGKETKFVIVATNDKGENVTKVLSVSRSLVESQIVVAALDPTQIKMQQERDAIAVIIGIADYRSLPKAEFANDDARVFYDYAIRALGVKPENIKLLVDADAEEVEIIKTFKAWLPSRVKTTTDVYVFYSGHGLPTRDGQGLYLLPLRADRDFISRTSIQFQEISADIQATKPKSVTIFMDACYSGQARSGETLVANARPVALRADKKLFPDNFTVITASQADQISSSSPDLKHGIFSYYLMKGMEGDADSNKDGKITLGEMQAYLVENVGRQAGMMSRKQEPQLIGDIGRVLVGR